jgi:transposase InsO family protein
LLAAEFAERICDCRRKTGWKVLKRGIRHLTTQAYRPRTNGKVERFHQTMAREWAYGLSYRSHRQRNHALPHWLDHYNRRRPHSSLGDRPPISRVHNVCG